MRCLHLLGGLETHLPSFASMTASGVRPPPLAMTLVPAAPGDPVDARRRAPGSHRLACTTRSASYTSTGYGVVGLPPPPAIAPTPWWVWFVGGTVAVGLGIGAAVWYAGQTAEPPGPEHALAAQPVVDELPSPPAPPPSPTLAAPRPKQVELRFDSLPSGGVFADGKSAELCRTPCAFNIDPEDGGDAERRTFIVKSEGYQDGVVVVDLTGPEREFRVTLEQLVTDRGPGDRAATAARARQGRQGGRQARGHAHRRPEVRQARSQSP